MAELAEGNRPATVDRISLTGRDGAVIPAIHAAPASSAAAGIVVHPDILGVRPLFDDLCRRLATHDYAVCAPEPFARAPEEVRNADDPAAAGVRMSYLPQLDDDLQLDDLVRAGDELRTRDGVDTLFVLGFCMGGMQTLKAAATGAFERAVAFYGMIRLPESWAGGTVREPIETVSAVCPTLAVFGGTDHFTPTDDIEALRAAWKDRPDCEIVVYPEAEHGFVHAPDRDAHRAADAADAWRRTLEFLHP